MKPATTEFNFLEAINGALQEASETIKKNKALEITKKQEQAEKDRKAATKIVNAMVPTIKKALIAQQLTIPVYTIPDKDLAKGTYNFTNAIGDGKTSPFPRMTQDVPDALIGVSKFVYDDLVEHFNDTLANMVSIGTTHHHNGEISAFEIRLEFRKEQIEQGKVDYFEDEEDE